MLQDNLYQAILARRSVRRYDRAPLDEATLARVRGIIAGVTPLVASARFEAPIQAPTPGQNLVHDLGGYGRVVNPPHYLVPYLLGGAHALADLGCRVEQVAVRLAAIGIGSCFIGCFAREEAVRARFGLPEGARIGAFLSFGRPSGTPGGRTVNALMRAGVGATNKLPAERICFAETFDRPATPPADLAPLLEAARSAPSAVNSQPWRFLWHGGRLHLFVKRPAPELGANGGYRLYDGGICMGNVLLAMEALGMSGHWALYAGNEPGIPPHPPGLLPLAQLHLV